MAQVKKTTKATRSAKPKTAPQKSVVKTKVIKKAPAPVKKTAQVKPVAPEKPIVKSGGFIKKSELVKKYRASAKDTGSVSVQVAQLTDRINQLAKHLTKHLHDFDSKRGLLILVGKRRRLLNYLRHKDEKTYTKLIKDLKLKK